MNIKKKSIIWLTSNNTFAVKKFLAVDDTTSNYLVYCSLRYEKPEGNLLINIELYSEEFCADLNSIWMDEMGLPERILEIYKELEG